MKNKNSTFRACPHLLKFGGDYAVAASDVADADYLCPACAENWPEAHLTLKRVFASSVKKLLLPRLGKNVTKAVLRTLEINRKIEEDLERLFLRDAHELLRSVKPANRKVGLDLLGRIAGETN